MTLTNLLDDFLVRAALAGIAVALAAAPLGCFVVWRRMAYFGDATAHAAILGVALALLLSLPIAVGVLLTALGMALGVSVLTAHHHAVDTMLGVMAHSALAVGLVAISFMPGLRTDLMGYLFGDILAVSRTELGVIWAGAAAVVLLLAWRWSALLTATLSADMAQAAGVQARQVQLVLTLALAVMVTVAIKIVGVLLIGALLIIPSATARYIARTPERMAFVAALIGCVSVVGGLGLAFWLDTPTGPTMVCLAAAMFALVSLGDQLRRM